MDFSKSYNLLLDKLSSWFDEFIQLLPNMALAALVFVFGLFIAKFLKRIAGKLINKVSKQQSLNSLFASFVHVFAVGIILFATLSILKLDKAVTSILAGAGIIGLALAFAFQDIAANFISGVFISFRRPMHIGDIVKVKDYMGIVKDINLRDTVLLTFQGQMVIIPNKDVFQNAIENYSLLGKRRMDLIVGISYGDDLQKVKEIVLNAVKKVSVRTDDDITFFYDEFGDSSINFEVRIWINNPDQPVWLQGRSEAIMYIKEAFDQNNITIPFPIRTLDFGIKGGEKLADISYFQQDKA
ncbi:MAG: mechanosensitive ion channel [Chitinophagales bacterium]|nr:mechanosensitive ion channel [Chitinophagaceae bacterium]MCB9064706.1 mechanosensitive ion channel [Chitinophagales bacterium]